METVTVTDYGYHTPHLRLYDVDFFGTEIEVTVTASPKSVRQWLSKTLFLHRQHRYAGRLVLGMGVQWTSFTADPDPPADTLQLCAGGRCLIFQLSRAPDVPRLLRRVLVDPGITLVGIWNSQDAKKLFLSDLQLHVPRVMDARSHAGEYPGDLSSANFETIVEECLGFEGVGLDPDVSRSNWAVPILSHRQVRQACADAYVSFEIGRIYRAWEWGQ